MNESEHTFPLPETEVQALERVQKQLQHQRLRWKITEFVRDYRWQMLAGVFIASALVEIFRRKRYHHSISGR
jgi:hypothetical protein